MDRLALGWRRSAVLLAIFLLSGASSLVYQILWVRVLSLTLGSTVYAISLVVSAFMAGLALGSAWFGKRVDRGGRPLRLYAFLELGIGISAVVLPVIFGLIARGAAVHTGPVAGLVSSAWFPFVSSFVLLLVPTTLMGGTLPVLSRYVAGFSVPRGASIGVLYTLNTAGAIVGTAATGFVLIRALGIHHTTLIAAGVNGVIFVTCLWLAARWPQPDPVRPRVAPTAGEEDVTRLLGAVTLVYLVNGLAGLALEVLWTRAILLFSINTIYAFTVILTTFLVGLAGGSAIMSALVTRVRRPATLLGGLQCVLALIAGLTPLALNAIGLPLFEEGKAITEPLGLKGRVVSAYVVAAAFMLPATLLMGASFPLVARIVAGVTDSVGSAVGRVYALNTVGAVAGSLLAGFVALPLVGIQRSILLFAGVAGLSGLYLVLRAGSRVWVGVGGVATAAIVGLFIFSPNYFQIMLSRTLDTELTFYEEGVETTVAVYDSESARRPVLVINNTALDDRGVVHKLLAHLPMLTHPDPQRALVLGFGVGISNASLATHAIPVNDCVEISPAVMHAAPYFAAINDDIVARDDTNFRVFLEDGRRLLLRETEPYDIIALDANSGNLRNAGVGKLYTRDFFQLCRDRLGEDGMATLYASPNGSLREFKMVARTFIEVFPHTSLWVDRVFGQTCVLLGSKQPFTLDLERFRERLDHPAVLADLEVYDLDSVGALLSCFLMGPELLGVFSADGELNTDDRPLMEFYPLDMSIFETDDRAISDVGFLLFRETIEPYLDYPEGTDWARDALEYVDKADQAFPSVVESWIHVWNSNMDNARGSLRLAQAIHPEAEYVRTRLGFGRQVLRDAMAVAESTGLGPDLGRAGVVSLHREEWERAIAYLRRALEALPRDDAEAERLRGQYELGLGRALLRVGDPEEAAHHVARASALGVAVTIDSLETVLARVGPDPAARIPILQQLTQASLQRLDLVPACRSIVELHRMEAASSDILVMCGRCMEAMGDFTGAWITYRDALELDPSSEGARVGLRRVSIELGLRLDALRRAHGDQARHWLPLSTRTIPGVTIPPSRIGVRLFDRPDAWLELVDLYGRMGRPFVAYRKARAARSVAPGDPATYEAIGRAARVMGEEEVARRAYETARAVGGHPDLAGVGARR